MQILAFASIAAVAAVATMAFVGGRIVGSTVFRLVGWGEYVAGMISSSKDDMFYDRLFEHRKNRYQSIYIDRYRYEMQFPTRRL